MADFRLCSIENCDKRAVARGYCSKHWRSERQSGTFQSRPAQSNVCRVEGCSGKPKARNLCVKHHHRFLRHGSPTAGRVDNGTLLNHLHNVVVPFKGDDCLIWPYTRDNTGYGKIRIAKKRHTVSRLVCELVHGPAPEASFHAAHICGKGHEGCVNPKHLCWKTRQDNELDKRKHGTSGHVLSEQDVREIRASAANLTHPKIAAMYGVSKSLVGQIVRRESWSWLD